MELGLKVVRGPEWKWGNQDSGEGHVGTVVEIGQPGSQTSPDKTVVVQWDSGARTICRVGLQGAYDLRIFDNATVGIKHTNIICDACRTQDIQGMRWKCTICHNLDLCTLCYMNDKHDINHSFLRFDTHSSKGVEVPKRVNSQSQKCQAVGIFVGATVTKNPDWIWGSQDVGDDTARKVAKISGCGTESGRSMAHVTSPSGSRIVYRMGHTGKVQLKYVDAMSSGPYYRNHLPVLGKFNEAEGPDTPCQFRVGDKVRCDLDVHILKQKQEGHGGWNPRMLEALGKIGVVKKVNAYGDLQVLVANQEWTFNPLCCTIVPRGEGDTNTTPGSTHDQRSAIREFTEAEGPDTPGQFRVGDKVLCDLEVDILKLMQEGHGVWDPGVLEYRKKIGTVQIITDRGDVGVQYDGRKNWTFHPGTLTKVPTFHVNDHVKICENLQQVKDWQAGHGKWNDVMQKVPTFHVNDHVKICENLQQVKDWQAGHGKWNDVMQKVPTFHVNDHVKICENLQQVKDWQAGHGKWNDVMQKTLGKTGVVKKVEANGDLRVLVNYLEWRFNPLCCMLVPQGTEDMGSIHDQRSAPHGHVIRTEESPSQSEEAALKKRLQELEDTINCPICLERHRNRVFQCGHATCSQCAEPLEFCPICRKVIKQKIHLF